MKNPEKCPKKRCGDQKWNLSSEMPPVHTVPKMWKSSTIVNNSCAGQKDRPKDVKPWIRTNFLFQTRCESSYSASTWKMTVFEIFQKTSNTWKFWQQLRSTLPPCHQLKTHICWSSYNLEYKIWSAHSEGEMVLLESRKLFRSGRGRANDNFEDASLDTITNFWISNVIFGLIVDWWRVFGHWLKDIRLILIRNCTLCL